MYKYARIFLVRIFFKVAMEGNNILHVFDEDTVVSEVFSLRFVLFCVTIFGVGGGGGGTHTSTFVCCYPVYLAFVKQESV